MTIEELEGKLGEHASRVKEIGEEIRSLVGKADADSEARYTELQTEQKRITEDVAPLLAEKKAAEQEAAVKATQDQLEGLLSQIRTSSKAGAVGGAPPSFLRDRQYVAGTFLRSLVDMRSGDPEAFTAGKASLEQISAYEQAWGKATLGSTDATGGWVVPNAIVEEIIKPAGFDDPYPALCTVIEGVTAPSVDLPFRSARPNRALVAAFGATKENVDLTYNGYTATMYTLARVHDVSNQFLRQSQGAAEADVMGELATAFALGERYYIISGSGSSEPYGLATAITNAPATFTSAFTAAATQAGSALSAIATAAGALAGRGRGTGLTAVVNASALWTAVVGQRHRHRGLLVRRNRGRAEPAQHRQRHGGDPVRHPGPGR